jgi:hypothetical protein
MESARSVVQLRLASLPSLLRPIAVHCWFTVLDEATGGWERWEVWQTPGAGGESWGHLHRNLMPPDRGVGGGPSRNAAEWHSEDAAAILAVLHDPLRYPYRDRYRYWPGPNSNTYVAWVLREAGIDHPLHPRAIGSGYLRLPTPDV